MPSPLAARYHERLFCSGSLGQPCVLTPLSYRASSPLLNRPISCCPGNSWAWWGPTAVANPTSSMLCVGYWASRAPPSCVASRCKTLFLTAPTCASRPVGPAWSWCLTTPTTGLVASGASLPRSPSSGCLPATATAATLSTARRCVGVMCRMFFWVPGWGLGPMPLLARARSAASSRAARRNCVCSSKRPPEFPNTRNAAARPRTGCLTPGRT